MELIHHIANATFPFEISFRLKIRRQNKKLSGLLKSSTMQLKAPRDHTKSRSSSSMNSGHRAKESCVFDEGAAGASKLVEPTGIEPVTSCLQSRRSPS